MTLPTVGGNDGTHGTVLNAHINVGHNSDGTNKGDNIIKAFAKVSDAGVLAAGSLNIASTAKDSTGIYTITWDTDFATTNYVVVASPRAGANRTAIPTSITTGSCAIHTRDGDGARIDANFMLMAIGAQ